MTSQSAPSVVRQARVVIIHRVSHTTCFPVCLFFFPTTTQLVVHGFHHKAGKIIDHNKHNVELLFIDIFYPEVSEREEHMLIAQKIPDADKTKNAKTAGKRGQVPGNNDYLKRRGLLLKCEEEFNLCTKSLLNSNNF